MRYLFCRHILAGLAAATFWTSSSPASTARYIFRHVNVIPMDREQVLRDRDVVVERGTIKAILKGGSAPTSRATLVIEAKGKFLLPGLIDFHTHPESANEFPAYLAHGVTTIVTAGGEGLDRTFFPTQASGPALIASSPPLRNSQSLGHFVVAKPIDVATVVRRSTRSGAAYIKVYSGTTLETFAAITSAAKSFGVPVIGHIPETLPRETVLRGIDLVAHSEELTRYFTAASTNEEIDALARQFIENDTALTPALAVVRAIDDQALRPQKLIARSNAADLPASIYHAWLPRNNGYVRRAPVERFAAAVRAQVALQRNWVRRFHAAGVSLISGSDSPITCLPGDCLQRDLVELHSLGLSNFEALRSATANPGRFLQKWRLSKPGATAGQVIRGARAELVLLEANPLDDLGALRKIDGVFAGGWHSRKAIEAQVAAMRRRNASRQAIVDSYEQLITSNRFSELSAFLLKVSPTDEPLLGQWVVYGDVDRLLNDGKRSEALALWDAASRILAKDFSVSNLAGTLKAKAGDKVAAAIEFRRSLQLAPLNAVATEGLLAIEGKNLKNGA